MWTRTGFSRAGAGGCQQGVSQERLEDWELRDRQELKAGILIEAKAIRPPPTRRPDPGEVAELDPKGLGLGAKPSARRGGLGQHGARGAPHPSLSHPARAPQSALGAARAMPAAPAAASARAESCRRRRRRLPRPDPLASRLSRSPALGQSRPCLALPSRSAVAAASARPLPPPLPSKREGWGKGAGAPSPFTSSRALPSLLSPNSFRHAGICSPAGQDRPAVLHMGGLSLPESNALPYLGSWSL